MRREFIIDGSKFNDLEGFYGEIDRLLTKDLEWQTGHNFNALNDLLRGGFGVHEYGEPILLRWINFRKSRQCLGYEATITYFEEILQTCHSTNIEYIKQQLANAKKHAGATLLDIIIEIILDTNNSGHDCELVINE
ncbi:MAG: hypothetical protein ACM3MK_08630 [Chitinophagales bacterium]